MWWHNAIVLQWYSFQFFYVNRVCWTDAQPFILHFMSSAQQFIASANRYRLSLHRHNELYSIFMWIMVNRLRWRKRVRFVFNLFLRAYLFGNSCMSASDSSKSTKSHERANENIDFNELCEYSISGYWTENRRRMSTLLRCTLSHWRTFIQSLISESWYFDISKWNLHNVRQPLFLSILLLRSLSVMAHRGFIFG